MVMGSRVGQPRAERVSSAVAAPDPCTRGNPGGQDKGFMFRSDSSNRERKRGYIHDDDYRTLLRDVHQSQQKVTITNFFDPLQSKAMSKKQWLALLALYVTYLFFGALVFFFLEQDQETARRQEGFVLYEKLIGALKQCDLNRSVTSDLESYCGKPLTEDADPELIAPRLWDFYNSVFFVITVVSTVGYGNIHPTTPLTRTIMVFYAIIGVPLNGILLTSLAQFFSTVFLRAHKKYRRYESRCGLAVDVLKYLVPGILFFLFLPAIAFYYFEGWTYEESVYFAFVTLTTIGFGDMVAGQTPNSQFDRDLVLVYKILLLCWIIFGLGYLIMLLGFITRAMRSKKMTQLEHKLIETLTHSKIWHGFSKDIGYLRRLMNELYLEKFKPVFLDDSLEQRYVFHRSKSLPNLCLHEDSEDLIQPVEMFRKRADSDYVSCLRKTSRSCSESDLRRIDRRKTFASATKIHPDELIRHVVGVMGGSSVSQDTYMDQLRGVEGFSDDEILRSEALNERKGNSSVSLTYTPGYEESMPTRRKRIRAHSECPYQANGSTVNSMDNMEWTWSGTGSSKIFDIVNERHRRNLLQENERNRRKKCLNALRSRMQRSSESISGSRRSVSSNFGSRTGESLSRTDLSTDDEFPQFPGDRRAKRYPQEDRVSNCRNEGNYVTYTAGSGAQGIGLVHGKQGLSRPERSLLELYMGGDHLFSKERKDTSEGNSLAEFLRVLSSLHHRIGSSEGVCHGSGQASPEPTPPPKLEALISLFSPLEPTSSKQKSSEKIQEPSNLKRLGRFLLRSYSPSVKAEPSADACSPIRDQPQSKGQKSKSTDISNLADNYFTVTGSPSVSIQMDEARSLNFSRFNVEDPTSITSGMGGRKTGARILSARTRRGSTPAMMTEAGTHNAFRSRIGINSESVFWDSRRLTPARRRPWESCSTKPSLSDVKEMIR